VIEWRRALSAGTLAASASKRADKARAEAAELARLRRQNARLRSELDKTREALAITGKRTRSWKGSPGTRPDHGRAAARGFRSTIT
jgi:transposase-like protein